MNWIALLLIALGFGLILIGWNGSYANVWYYLTGSQMSQQGGNPEPPQNRGPGGTQNTPPQVPPGGQHQGSSGGYSFDLGNHFNG